MKPATIPAGDFPIIEKRTFDLHQPSKISVRGSLVSESQYCVRDSDQDIIGHTNNASYLEWASNILTSQSISYSKIEANYTGESFTGDEVSIRLLKEDEGSKLSVEVLNPENQQIFKLKASH